MELPTFLGFVTFILVTIVLVTVLVYWKPSNESDSESESESDSKKDVSGSELEKKGKVPDVVVYEEPPFAPYATTPINSVDDYEYSMVFQQEGDKAMTKAQRDLLMSQYPMDWTVQPPSSALFQQGLAKFKEAFENPSKQKAEWNSPLLS